ncbi:unnamed protein product [Ectocarpus sp. CCAP 1310/34]|nr:unnamed protein product [Ectocarpus sp. CCAP 1310/34]
MWGPRISSLGLCIALEQAGGVSGAVDHVSLVRDSLFPDHFQPVPLLRSTPRDAGGGHESEKRRRRKADGHGDQDAGRRHGRGGGWLFGTVDAHDNISRDIAEATRMIVVSVGYRLAPEVKFPGPVKDGVSAIRWAKKNIWAFGGDPHRIAIVGESSGANLAITSGKRPK